MVLADFLTETRRKWLKAFKLFKSKKARKPRNRVSPELIRSPSYSGTVDASAEIDLHRFCSIRASMPPLSSSDYSYSSYNSYSDGSRHSLDGANSDVTRTDSAYNSARSSPAHQRSMCYATVTYFNVNDNSEDSSSVRTEFTLLEEGTPSELGEDERAQNLINESLELVSTL